MTARTYIVKNGKHFVKGTDGVLKPYPAGSQIELEPKVAEALPGRFELYVPKPPEADPEAAVAHD